MSTCTNCGYTHAISPALSAEPRSPMASIAGARAKLETATQDLFRLSGNSIPVDASSLAPAAPRKPEPEPLPVPVGSAQSEASIIFSLEELMKTGTPSTSSKQQNDEPDQLWSMQAETPLFGTAQDLALLTAPAAPAKGSSLDSMTLESVRPVVRRWLPVGLGLAGVALLAASAFAFWPGSGSTEPSSEPSAAAELAPAAEPEAPASPAAEAPAPAAAEPVPAAAPEAPAAEVPGAAGAPGAGEVAADDAASDEEEEAEDDADEASSSKASSAKAKAKVSRKKKAAARKVSSAAKGPFDKAAAKRALAAAAAKAGSCRTGGAGGTGKVQLTFATSGKVSSAKIVGGSLSQAASSCALRHFRAARVPAFTGSALTVAKSFKIP